MSIELVPEEIKDKLISKMDNLSYGQLIGIVESIENILTKFENLEISQFELFDISTVASYLMQNYPSEENKD